MSASLRAALHRCADILADALESEVEALPATKQRPKKSRRPRNLVLPDVMPEIDEQTAERVRHALRKSGVAA